MAVTQTLITPDIIAKLALMHLKNNLVMGQLVHRGYEKELNAKQIGDTISVRKPIKFVANNGVDISSQIQKVYETTIDVKLDTNKNVAWQFSSNELTMEVDEYSKRYIQPAMIVLADKVDTELFTLYKDVFNAVGTPGTTPSAFTNITAAAQRLTENDCPYGDRNLVLNPTAYWKMADAFKDMHVLDVSKPALRGGKVVPIAGFDIYESQNVPTHLTGAATSGTKVKTTATKDTSLVIVYCDGGTSTMTEGDIFTIDTVFAVNPVGKGTLSHLKQFVATGDVADVSNGEIGVARMTMSNDDTVGPAYQNMSAYPVDEDDITLFAQTEGSALSYVSNLAFHKNAFALVTAPLAMPDGATFKGRASADGLSVRVIKGYNILTDKDIIRIDILFGVKTLYPELACRVAG